MDDKKLYSDKRWTEPMAYKVVGHVEVTPKEQEEARKKLLKFIKDNEELKKNN